MSGLCWSRLFSRRNGGVESIEAFAEAVLKGGMFGLTVEVLRLVGVGVEVVELELFRLLLVVVDQLVAFGADATMGGDVLRIRVLVVVVEPLFAEVGVGVGCE